MEKNLLLHLHRIEHAPVGIHRHQMSVFRNKIDEIVFGIGCFHAQEATLFPTIGTRLSLDPFIFPPIGTLLLREKPIVFHSETG